MYHHKLGMDQKWRKHYRETNSVLFVVMIIFGVTFTLSLSLIWPQHYSSLIFNSKMNYRTIMDVHDYWTCDPDYYDFVVDNPPTERSMITMYVYNVTNPDEIIQRGYKPKMKETGPYGFSRESYKYNVTFHEYNATFHANNTGDGSHVYFEEYYILKPIEDPKACELMFYRTDRVSSATLENPCSGGKCLCQSIENPVMTINPQFLKLIYKETSTAIIAEFSADVFSQIKDTLLNEFPLAVESHLITGAFLEIVSWRNWMKTLNMIEIAYDTAISSKGEQWMKESLDYTSHPHSNDALEDCGLGNYGMYGSCRGTWHLGASHQAQNIIDGLINPISPWGNNYYPPSHLFFNKSSDYSFLTEKGITKWLVITQYLGLLKFNNKARNFVTISMNDQRNIYEDMLDDTYKRWQNDHSWSLSPYNVTYTKTVVQGYVISRVTSVARYIAENWVNKLQVSRIKYFLLPEWTNTSHPVLCSPAMSYCIWQWGFMKESYNASDLAFVQSEDLVSPDKCQSTNPLCIASDINAGVFFNSFDYCSNYLAKGNVISQGDLTCLKVSDELYYNFRTRLPAALWGSELYDNGNGYLAADPLEVDQQDAEYRYRSDEEQQKYLFQACNLSILMYQVYKNQTLFHSNFVLDFINSNKFPDDEAVFPHIFKPEDDISDLGYAQWAGGYVTQAVFGVRAVYQVDRRAMWWIGIKDYHDMYLEFSTWANRYGYPHAKLGSIADAKLLLNALARTDRNGAALRNHIAYSATTIIGSDDGSQMQNGVGLPGERAYGGSVDTANFTCYQGGTNPDIDYSIPTDDFDETCELLNRNFISGHDKCQEVQDMYSRCMTAAISSTWVVNCEIFRTALDIFGSGSLVPCTESTVYSRPHPHEKKLGNLIHSMTFSLTNQLVTTSHLWCTDRKKCNFNIGGLFKATKAKKVLFEGVSDSTYLKFYNMKYKGYGINFHCREVEYDKCGTELYNCSDAGIDFHMPTGDIYNFAYKTSPTDQYYYSKYFTPNITYSTVQQKILWPDSQNPEEAIRDSNYIASAAIGDIIHLNNPHWAAFPALASGDTEWIKFSQAQGRQFSGPPDRYKSNINRMNTGKKEFTKAHRMEAFKGNASLFYMKDSNNRHVVDGTAVDGAEALHQESFGWDGFYEYPYLYKGKTDAEFFSEELEPQAFNKILGLPFQFSQRGLDPFTATYDEANQNQLPIPHRDTKKGSSPTPDQRTTVLNARKYVESSETWARMQPYDDGRPLLGTALNPYKLTANNTGPRDSYGMPYRVPLDMVSMETVADLPLFVGSVHQWINDLWENFRYDGEWVGDNEVSQTIFGNDDQPDIDQHRSFIDVEPISGLTIRQALRTQVNLRLERGPMFTNIISSQGRCTVPNRYFTGGTGYGCFAYVPLLWFEDAKVIDSESIFRIEDHFYGRPDRYYSLTIIGAIVGIICIITGITCLMNETYHRNRFYKRVYVD